MRPHPPCPDCGRPQIQLAVFDPDLILYCEACGAESFGEVDRNYPSGEVFQEFENEQKERDSEGRSGRGSIPKLKTKPFFTG